MAGGGKGHCVLQEKDLTRVLNTRLERTRHNLGRESIQELVAQWSGRAGVTGISGAFTSFNMFLHDILITISSTTMVRGYENSCKIEIICGGTPDRLRRMFQSLVPGQRLDVWGAVIEDPVADTAVLVVDVGTDVSPGPGYIANARVELDNNSLVAAEACAGTAGFLRAVRNAGGLGEAAIELDEDISGFGSVVYRREAKHWVQGSIADHLTLDGIGAIHIM